MARYFFYILFSLLANSVHAREWSMLGTDSQLSFSGVYQNEAFQGRFKKFSATIQFDATDLSQSKFDVTVDIPSVSTDNEERDSALAGDDFFNFSKYPKAHFVTTAFRKTSAGRIEADGTLTIRNKSKPVTLQVKFVENGNHATLDIDTLLNRLDFDIGNGDWKDIGLIGAEVKVHSHLILSAK